MGKTSINITETIDTCDLCSEPLDPLSSYSFQNIVKLKEERPLKKKWYHALRYAFDGKPTYEVHHSCLYDLLRNHMEQS